MNPISLPMAPIKIVDIAGSILMIIFAFLCLREALALKRKEPRNIIRTYLLWLITGLFIFVISRATSHLLKYALISMGNFRIWDHLRLVTGSLNTIAFVIVGAITLFFQRIYYIYRQMEEEMADIERGNKKIIKLNKDLEKGLLERTLDLSASEEKYWRVFEGSKDMLFICDKNGNFMDINRSGVELLGFSDRKEVLGKNFFGEFVMEPDSINIKKDIEHIDFLKDVDITLRKMHGEELLCLITATSRKEDNGKPGGFEGTLKDITIRKTMERQLRQADKLASLGQLSAGVAHEINNPLGLILGYTQLILRDVEDKGQLHDDLKVIERHTMNCKKIVEDLLKFSRSMETTKTPANLNELLNEVLSVVETNFEMDKVHIVRQLAGELPPVTADPDKMRQVFMNLLMNAHQAIEGPGAITVSTSITPDGQHILISFADTGSGIPNDIVHKIFDPFFTTKPIGMGTGLGLSVSYGIIKDHDGDIRVESSPGNGSTFKVYLPVDKVPTE